MLYISLVPHSGEVISEEYNCFEHKHVHRLLAKLEATDTSSPVALQLVIVPDLSPVILEILGRRLQIDHRVFVNHLWTYDRQPFDLPNFHAYDLHTCLDQGPDTTTIDCDINFTAYTDRDSRDWLDRNVLINFYRRKFESYQNFLSPTMIEWPAWLACPPRPDLESVQYHGTSRITIHHLLSPNSTPTGMSLIKTLLRLLTLLSTYPAITYQ